MAQLRDGYTTEGFEKDLKKAGVSEDALKGANLKTIFQNNWTSEGIDAAIDGAVQELGFYEQNGQKPSKKTTFLRGFCATYQTC